MEATSLYAIPAQEFESLVAEIKELRIFLRDFRLTNSTPELPESGGIELAEKVLGRGKSWIYKMTSEGKLPFRKFNNTLIFDRKELEAFLEKNIADPWTKEIQVNDALAESAKKKLEQSFKRK